MAPVAQRLWPDGQTLRSALTGLGDNRGVVYVEFLIAFFPFFLLFLGTCQLTLLVAARVIVSHSAAVAVRSAIVVLEDPADDYNGAQQGSLSEGKSSSPDFLSLLGQSGAQNSGSWLANDSASTGASSSHPAQQGARMGAIRLAAYMPLMTLAPSESSVTTPSDSIDRSLVSNTGTQLAFAYGYTEAATAVSVHSSESSEELASEPLDKTGLLTVRVTYLYYCGIPIVRALMCSSLPNLLDTNSNSGDSAIAQRLKNAANPSALTRWISGSPRFTILTGQATLPNQGANYTPEQASQ
jgi:Flp pilus assembly protein TadG